jgi:hypothetical protein
MKRMPGVFVLSKSEQRVVLIVMLALIVVALLGYERRAYQPRVQPISATESKASPSPSALDDEQ